MSDLTKMRALLDEALGLAGYDNDESVIEGLRAKADALEAEPPAEWPPAELLPVTRQTAGFKTGDYWEGRVASPFCTTRADRTVTYYWPDDEPDVCLVSKTMFAELMRLAGWKPRPNP